MDTLVSVLGTVGLVITVVFLGFMLISGGLMMLSSRKRHWIMSLVRLGIVFVAALISVPVSKTISGAFSGQLCSLVLNNIGTDMEEFIAEAPAAAESISLLLSLLIAPILFIFVFLLLRGLMALLAWIVEKSVPVFRHKPIYNLAISLPVGAVTGILFATIVILPLCCCLALGNSAIDAAQEMTANQYEVLKDDLKEIKAEQKEDPDEDTDYRSEIRSIEDSMEDLEETEELLNSVKTITDGSVVRVVNTIGKPLFQWMTSGSMDYEGQKIQVSLTEDIPAIADSVTELTDASQGIADGDVTNKDKKSLNQALENFMAYDLIACMMADSIGYISDIWLDGDAFLGIESPDMGSMLQPIYHTSLQVMADSDMETLREDVLTVADVLTDLIAAGVAGGDDYEEMMLALAEDDLMTALVAKLERNRHMAPVALEVKNLSVRLVASAMGDLLKDTEQYDPLMDDVANEMTKALSMDSETRHQYLEYQIGIAFAENDIQVPGVVAVEMSERAMEELGRDGVIEKQELKDYYINCMETEELDAA